MQIRRVHHSSCITYQVGVQAKRMDGYPQGFPDSASASPQQQYHTKTIKMTSLLQQNALLPSGDLVHSARYVSPT